MNNQSPTSRQLQLPIVEGVASRIEAILQRCGDRVKVGSVLFDERGEAMRRLWRPLKASQAKTNPPGGRVSFQSFS